MRTLLVAIFSAAVLGLVIFLWDPSQTVVANHHGKITEFVERQSKFRHGPEGVFVELNSGEVVLAKMWIDRSRLLAPGTPVQVEERSGA